MARNLRLTMNSPINIITPSGTQLGQEPASAIAEVFLSKLLRAPEKEITLSVQPRTKIVASSDAELRATVRLILGAGRLPELVSSIKRLLHAPSVPTSLGYLLCEERGTMRRFDFFGDFGEEIDSRIIAY